MIRRKYLGVLQNKSYFIGFLVKGIFLCAQINEDKIKPNDRILHTLLPNIYSLKMKIIAIHMINCV